MYNASAIVVKTACYMSGKIIFSALSPNFFLIISSPTIFIKHKGYTARAYPFHLVQGTGLEPAC